MPKLNLYFVALESRRYSIVSAGVVEVMRSITHTFFFSDQPFRIITTAGEIEANKIESLG